MDAEKLKLKASEYGIEFPDIPVFGLKAYELLKERGGNLSEEQMELAAVVIEGFYKDVEDYTEDIYSSFEAGNLKSGERNKIIGAREDIVGKYKDLLEGRLEASKYNRLIMKIRGPLDYIRRMHQDGEEVGGLDYEAYTNEVVDLLSV